MGPKRTLTGMLGPMPENTVCLALAVISGIWVGAEPSPDTLGRAGAGKVLIITLLPLDELANERFCPGLGD